MGSRRNTAAVSGDQAVRLQGNALATSHNRRITILLSAAAAALVLAALLVGVSDNPPGLALVALAAVTLLVAAVHPWRAPRRFVLLFVASGIGLVVLVVLHNLLDGVAGLLAEGNVLRTLVEGVGVLAFLLAIFVLPAAAVVGAGGALVMLIRERWSAYRTVPRG
jgi:hypothetical protein